MRSQYKKICSVLNFCFVRDFRRNKGMSCLSSISLSDVIPNVKCTATSLRLADCIVTKRYGKRQLADKNQSSFQQKRNGVSAAPPCECFISIPRPVSVPPSHRENRTSPA